MSLCCHQRFTRTHQRHRFLDGRPRSRTPSGIITGPPVGPWTRSVEPYQRAHACVVHRATHTSPRGRPVNSRVKPAVKRAPFLEKPLCFCRINPQSILIQSNCFLVLFLFTLDPVFSRISTRSPITMNVHIFHCFNSKIGSVYLHKCHYILFHV